MLDEWVLVEKDEVALLEHPNGHTGFFFAKSKALASSAAKWIKANQGRDLSLRRVDGREDFKTIVDLAVKRGATCWFLIHSVGPQGPTFGQMELVDMTPVRGETFTDVPVDVDGKHFIDCSFTKCALQYSGGEHFKFENSATVDCTFHLCGPARKTLEVLRSLYTGVANPFLQPNGQAFVTFITAPVAKTDTTRNN